MKIQAYRRKKLSSMLWLIIVFPWLVHWIMAYDPNYWKVLYDLLVWAALKQQNRPHWITWALIIFGGFEQVACYFSSSMAQRQVHESLRIPHFWYFGSWLYDLTLVIICWLLCLMLPVHNKAGKVLIKNRERLLDFLMFLIFIFYYQINLRVITTRVITTRVACTYLAL